MGFRLSVSVFFSFRSVKAITESFSFFYTDRERGEEPMVELKTLELQQYRYVLITLRLPHWTCRMIVCTAGVLVDESWNLSALERRGLAGFQTDRRGMAAMLDGKITAVTSTAAQNGIYIGMSGREALLKVMYEKEKNGQS